MTQSTKFNLLAVLAFFCAIITLGGLGNIAVQETFYWLPFVVNIGVYGAIIWKLFKRAQED